MNYKFAECDCQQCPIKERCLGRNAKYRNYSVKMLSEDDKLPA